MRLIATLFVCLLALPASGQGATPDTTDPATYYPLEVGNRWEYEPEVEGPDFEIYSRVSIVADTLVGGDPWFVRRSQRFRRFSAEAPFILDADIREVVRFDSTQATIVRWEGAEAVLDFPCRLDGPLGDGVPACDRYSTYQKYPGDVLIGTDRVETITVYFDDMPPGPTFAARLGDVGQAGEAGSPGRRLAFASVSGATYGEPVEGMHTLPDLTPPWMYYPLAVGNVWEYEVFDPGGTPVSFTRRELTSESTIDGVRYVVETRRRLQPAGTWGSIERTLLLRFDSTSGRVMSLTESGGEWPVSCPLGADFHSHIEDDPLGCRDASANPFAPDHKTFTRGPMETVIYQRGVGPWRDAGPDAELRLSYARVGSIQRGNPYPVTEDGTPKRPRLRVDVSPNPASGPATVRLALPEAADVTVEVFDVRGRRVARTEAVLPAGAQRITLDAAAWAPGLYVVRVTAGDATASGTVVRR